RKAVAGAGAEVAAVAVPRLPVRQPRPGAGTMRVPATGARRQQPGPSPVRPESKGVASWPRSRATPLPLAIRKTAVIVVDSRSVDVIESVHARPESVTTRDDPGPRVHSAFSKIAYRFEGTAPKRSARRMTGRFVSSTQPRSQYSYPRRCAARCWYHNATPSRPNRLKRRLTPR